MISEKPKHQSRLEIKKRENFDSRLENISNQLQFINKQVDFLKYEYKLNKQDALLAEYKQLLEEASLQVGHGKLTKASKMRINILETKLA